MDKDLAISMTEKWLVKMTELAEMAQLTCLTRENTVSKFIRTFWVCDFLSKKRKCMIYGFND